MKEIYKTLLSEYNNRTQQKSEPEQYKPIIGQVYFSVDDLFLPKAFIWHNSKADNLKIDNFNVFKMFDDCKATAEIVKSVIKNLNSK